MVSFVPLTTDERQEMLEAIGLRDVEELFEAIPESVRFPSIDIGPAQTELEITRRVDEMASRNRPATGPFFLGAGAYRHFIPAAIGAIQSRSEFLTSYTPYQPEVSQGTLQASFEFQSLICDLTGMDVTNASVYDGASAMAEAALMAMRITSRSRIVVSGAVHPHYRQVLNAYLDAREPEVATGEVSLGLFGLQETGLLEAIDEETACVIVSQPTFFGEIRDLGPVLEAARAVGAMVVEVYNPISLGLLKPPGAWGVDIAVAEGQPLGVSLTFGGPYVGLMSCRREHVRQIPGRIVGMAKDSQGRRGYVLTLQAREQHIRREKATSNICTSQTLISLATSLYLSLLGPHGLRSVAEACWQTTHYAAEQLASLPGVKVVTPAPFFHEFAIETPLPAADLNRHLLGQGIVGGYDLGQTHPALSKCSLLCCTELTTRADVDRLVRAMDLSPQPPPRRGEGEPT